MYGSQASADTIGVAINRNPSALRGNRFEKAFGRSLVISCPYISIDSLQPRPEFPDLLGPSRPPPRRDARSTPTTKRAVDVFAQDPAGDDDESEEPPQITLLAIRQFGTVVR